MSNDLDKVLYSGTLGIEYGQFYVDIDDDDFEDYLEPEAAFEHQNNGICGAAQTGKLFLVAGTQDGVIEIEVKLHSSEPTVDDTYEEIVEVSIEIGKKQLMLCEWGNETTHNLNINPGTYNVRYSIIGMEKEYNDDSDWESPIPGQRYYLQFWPGQKQKDVIKKCTSETAKYWHKEWGNLE